jgi:histidine triad (HIT) family protein
MSVANIKLEGVRLNTGGRIHLTPRVPRSGPVSTLCGKSLPAGKYSSSSETADCVACNRRSKDPGRVSTAFFASDEGTELLRLSLEQARFRNPTPREGVAQPTKAHKPAAAPERPALRPRVITSGRTPRALPACPICAVAIQQPPTVVHRGTLAIAYLDAKQLRKGHVIVAPIRHVESIYELNAPTGAELMSTMIRVSNAIKSAFDPVEVSILSTSGARESHFLFHVVPRGRKDPPLNLLAPSKKPTSEDLELQALAIREHIRPV